MVTFSKTIRGLNKLVFDNYMYTGQKPLANEYFRWQCVLRGQKSCKGAVKAYQDGSNPEITCPHNHAPDSVAVALDEHRNLVKTAAQETLEKPQQILSHALLQLDEEARAAHRKITVKRALRGEHSANMPPEPNEWPTNGNVNNPSNFMLHDNGINAGERVIIFATEENLRRLCVVYGWKLCNGTKFIS